MAEALDWQAIQPYRWFHSAIVLSYVSQSGMYLHHYIYIAKCPLWKCGRIKSDMKGQNLLE